MTKDLSEKDKEAIAKAGKEISTLLVGKEQATPKELFELRRHVKSRVDITKPDNELTPVEDLWKKMYVAIDDLIAQNIPQDEKRRIDDLEINMDEMDAFGEMQSNLIVSSKKIEKLLFKQGALLIVASDKSDENEFSRRKTLFEKAMLDKNSTSEKRMQSAKAILELANVFQKLTVEELKSWSKEISHELSFFEKEFHKYLSFKLSEETEKELQAKNISRFRSELTKWLDYSKEIQLARILAIDSLAKQIETDRMLPDIIIERNGDIVANLSNEQTEKFKNNLLSYSEMMITANEKEKEARKELDPVRKELFGDLFDEELANEIQASSKPTQSETTLVTQRVTNPLEIKPWFRFLKVLYVFLWIVGVGFSLLLGAALGAGAFVVSIIIVWVIMVILKKSFFYVALGSQPSK